MLMGTRILSPLNIDGSVMGHEIYMKHWVGICISCDKKHVWVDWEMEASSSEKKALWWETKVGGERHTKKKSRKETSDQDKDLDSIWSTASRGSTPNPPPPVHRRGLLQRWRSIFYCCFLLCCWSPVLSVNLRSSVSVVVVCPMRLINTTGLLTPVFGGNTH